MFLQAVRDTLANGFVLAVCRSAQYAELAGEGSPYADALKDIDATIGELKRLREHVQAIAEHMHDFNEDDYCSICGADGRA